MSEEDDALLSIKDVMARTSLGRSTIYRLIDAKKFPDPVQVTTARVGWLRSEVNAWVKARPRATGVAA